jgi:hypothetical protein
MSGVDLLPLGMANFDDMTPNSLEFNAKASNAMLIYPAK